MTVAWDARINGYFADESAKPTGVAGPSGAFLANGTILVQPFNSERAYSGFDAEIGALLWTNCDGSREVRVFAGGFHFETNVDFFPEISGPRGRVETRLFDLPGLEKGSRVTFGAEVT